MRVIKDIHIGGPRARACASRSALAGRGRHSQCGAATRRADASFARGARGGGCLRASARARATLHAALEREATEWVSPREMGEWSRDPDEKVIGQRFSPACYIKDAFPAALYLAWKYHHDFSAGIIANANVGGDNCHRGAVVGALLGAAMGVPERWRTGLLAHGRLVKHAPAQ